MIYSGIKNKILDTLTLAGKNISGELVINIDNFVNERQRLIQSAKSWWFQRAVQTFNTVATQRDYALPADYKDDFWLYITIDDIYRPIRMVSMNDILRFYTNVDKGRPEHYVITEPNISFYPIPDKVYAVTNLYYKFLSDLSADSDTNVLTQQWPELLISGALSEAFTLLGDIAAATVWETKYAAYMKELNARDIDYRLPSDFMMVPRTDAYMSGLEGNRPKVLKDYY